MQLASFLGKEKLDVEFKEFCIQQDPRSLFSPSELLAILTTGALDIRFNCLVLGSLEHYIHNFVPKYISSYVNSGVHGRLYFGVSDGGEITGIPYLGPLPKDEIIRKIHSTVKTRLSSSCVDYSVEIERLSVQNDKLNHSEVELNTLLDQYYSQLKKYRQAMSTYYYEKSLWIHKISRYETKLYNILNDCATRWELADYISNRCKCNTCKQNCELLWSTTEIKVSVHSVWYLKTEPHSIFYWATRFKDESLEQLFLLRPTKPKRSVTLYPDIIFKRLTPLRKLCVEQNPTLAYYIIVIRTRPRVYNEMCFYWTRQNNWSLRRRLLINAEPVNSPS